VRSLCATLKTQLVHVDGARRISSWQKQEAACRAIAQVPGIGKLTATALVATIGEAKAFKSGRELAAFLGLVLRQSGTGGKIRLGSISKRGDSYLRTLLIHGARSVMYHTKAPTAWQKGIQARRPPTWRRWPWPTRWYELRGRSWLTAGRIRRTTSV
jgi:transposase